MLFGVTEKANEEDFAGEEKFKSSRQIFFKDPLDDSNKEDEAHGSSRLRLFKLMLGRTVLTVLKDEKYAKIFEQQVKKETFMSKISQKQIISLKVEEDQDMVLAISRKSYKTKLEQQFLINALSQIEFFENNEYLIEQPHKLCSAIHVLHSSKGQVLCNQGDLCQTFYIVVKGQVLAMRPKAKTNKLNKKLTSSHSRIFISQQSTIFDQTPQSKEPLSLFSRENSLQSQTPTSKEENNNNNTPKNKNLSTFSNANNFINNNSINNATPTTTTTSSKFAKQNSTILGNNTPKRLFNRETSRILWYFCYNIQILQVLDILIGRILLDQWLLSSQILKLLNNCILAILLVNPSFSIPKLLRKKYWLYGSLNNKKNFERDLTYVCGENCDLLTLKKQDFDELVDIQKESEERQKIEFLEQFEIFQSFSRAMLTQVLSEMETVNLQKGQFICREGDENKYIYFIRQGEIKISFSYFFNYHQQKNELQSSENIYQDSDNVKDYGSEQYQQCSSLQQFDDEIKNKKQIFQRKEQKKNMKGENNIRKSLGSSEGLKLSLHLKSKTLDIIILQNNTFFGEEDVCNQKSTKKYNAACSSIRAKIFMIDAQKLMKILKQNNNFDKLVQSQKNKNSWYVQRRKELIKFMQKQEEKAQEKSMIESAIKLSSANQNQMIFTQVFPQSPSKEIGGSINQYDYSKEKFANINEEKFNILQNSSSQQQQKRSSASDLSNTLFLFPLIPSHLQRKINLLSSQHSRKVKSNTSLDKNKLQSSMQNFTNNNSDNLQIKVSEPPSKKQQGLRLNSSTQFKEITPSFDNPRNEQVGLLKIPNEFKQQEQIKKGNSKLSSPNKNVCNSTENLFQFNGGQINKLQINKLLSYNPSPEKSPKQINQLLSHTNLMEAQDTKTSIQNKMANNIQTSNSNQYYDLNSKNQSKRNSIQQLNKINNDQIPQDMPSPAEITEYLLMSRKGNILSNNNKINSSKSSYLQSITSPSFSLKKNNNQMSSTINGNISHNNNTLTFLNQRKDSIHILTTSKEDLRSPTHTRKSLRSLNGLFSNCTPKSSLLSPPLSSNGRNQLLEQVNQDQILVSRILPQQNQNYLDVNKSLIRFDTLTKESKIFMQNSVIPSISNFNNKMSQISLLDSSNCAQNTNADNSYAQQIHFSTLQNFNIITEEADIKCMYGKLNDKLSSNEKGEEHQNSQNILKISQSNEERFGKRITSVLKLNKCVSKANKNKIIDLIPQTNKINPLFYA